MNLPGPTKTIPVWLFIVVGALLLCLVAATIIFIGNNWRALDNKPNQADDLTAGRTATAAPSNQVQPNPSPVTDEGVTWLSSPEPISNLGLLVIPSDEKAVTQKDIHYFKVGADGGKDIILAEYLFPEPGANYGIYHFIKQAEGQYEYLSRISETLSDDQTYSKMLLDKKKVVGQNPKLFNSLAYQQKLSLKNVDVESTGDHPQWFLDELKFVEADPNSKLSEFAATAYGTVFRLSVSRPEGYFTETYILRRPNGTSARYQLRPPFLRDDSVPAVVWNDGKANSSEYRIDGITACGTPAGIATLDPSAEKDLKAAGKTDAGETIYEFSDPNNKLVQTLVRGYNETRRHIDPPTTVTAEEYLAKHAIFVYRDKLDRLVLFNGGEYGPLAECGKPVIYLYPAKAQQVSVKVDADITVSDPAYGDGWHVFANPDGTLINSDGKKYDSLFWEGNGKVYPAITEGYVVRRKEVDKTLREHLSLLGLNSKESSDFMEFWLPKMPSDPYVRLTWFGTRQMNRLAPLTIEPAPDSIIRVFLDFEGLKQPINIRPQRLSAAPRQGFTVIEWGGLLRK